MSYEISLRQILKARDTELFGRLKKIEKIARSLLSYTHGKFPYYTPHNFSHSLNVEENLNWIIVDDLKEKMNAHEIFFLIVATWMHDWGMVGKPEEDPEKIRELHHLRTERNFEEMYNKLFLSEHEGRIIGRICRGHTKEDLYSEDFDDFVFGTNIRIRRRFLAAVLRIADELDITCNRTPEIIYYSLNPTDKAEEEFQKHLSISGVGQLDERHKIYISAISRDPKGAETLRNVRDKIQHELNGIKGILAQYGIVLDYIELRLETRGFIDKPISFEVDRKKIVALLIGEHLYKNPDVAIRELVQNSIDACKLRKQVEPDISFKIVVKKPSEDILEVEDNGIGMDFSAAKRFLSIVGSSFYTSEEFKQFIKNKRFDPIAQFGIGIMSCFLISEGIIVETKKKGVDPCRFTIDSTEQAWKYEKGSLENPGTKIVLKLNKEGKMIKLQKTFEKHLIESEIPIYYQADNGEVRAFKSTWSIDQIVERFYNRHDLEISSNEILRFETEDYRIILGTVHPPTSGRQLILFNHGVYVGNFSVDGLEMTHIICVDLKRNLFDLQISREDIIRNRKWQNFVYNMSNTLFDTMSDRYLPDEWKTYVWRISKMVERRYSIHMEKMKKLDDRLEELPFLRSLVKKVFFPVKSKSATEFHRLDSILEDNEITLYHVHSMKPLEELSLVFEFIPNIRTTIFNPYEFPEIRIRNEKNEYTKDLLRFFFEEQDVKIYEIDLLNILVENCSPLKIDFKDLIPNNVKLVRFPKDWKPLVVIKKKPVILQTRDTLGASYWANIALWKSLIGKDRVHETFNGLEKMFQNLGDYELLSAPIVYVDAEDEFLKRLFDLRRKKRLDTKLSKKMIFRYLSYLSFLPIAIYNFYSCLIFLETLDSLEMKIAHLLNFERPRPLLQRMGTIRNVYLGYLKNQLIGLYEIKEAN